MDEQITSNAYIFANLKFVVLFHITQFNSTPHVPCRYKKLECKNTENAVIQKIFGIKQPAVQHRHNTLQKHRIIEN